jgi:hypothetical protein
MLVISILTFIFVAKADSLPLEPSVLQVPVL